MLLRDLPMNGKVILLSSGAVGVFTAVLMLPVLH